MSIAIDDLNGENFDHSGLGFFGGGYIVCANGGAPPISGRVLPKGEPRWGVGWKQAEAKWYRCNTRFNTQGSVCAHRDNFMDLDPTYKDALGRPMIRLTYNATDNDHKMSRYLVEKMEGVIKAMNPTHYEVHNRPKNFTIVPYQSTHCTGGTIMGADPESGVVNRYLQVWGAHKLFVQGASVFPRTRPELTSASTPKATKIARATGDRRTSQFLPRGSGISSSPERLARRSPAAIGPSWAQAWRKR